jgi:hypothetical protein
MLPDCPGGAYFIPLLLKQIIFLSEAIARRSPTWGEIDIAA